jgi:hypothetical protein
MRRWLSLVAMWVIACHGKDAPPPPSPNPVDTHISSAVSASTPGPRPELLPTEEPGVAPPTPAARFSAEQVDRGWKARTEGELRERLARLPGGAPQIECHTSMCQLLIRGTQVELTTAIHDLEQLQDVAHRVVLSHPEDAGGGALSLRAYVRFERSDLGD